VQAFLMPFIGPYVDKFNPGRVILANGALMSAGLILASYSSNIYEFTAAFSFIFGLGATAVYAAPIALASKWFVDKKGFAIGLTLFGMGLAPLVMAPAAVKMIALYGVLETLRILGAIIFVVILLLFYPIKFPPAGYAPAGWEPPQSAGTVDTAEYPRGLMLRSRSFHGLWFCFMTASACGLMVIGITHQAAVEMYKISEASAAFAISVFAFFNALGRPFWGLVIDRLNPKITACVSFVLMGCASLAMAGGTPENVLVFYAAVPLIWFCYGGWLSIAPSLTANFFGVKNSSRNYGVVFTAFGAGAIIGNLLAGRVKDFYGSYSPAFYIMAACSLAGIVTAALTLTGPRKD
nr:OFA family MFS transporter [Candidatus Wallbacteria bacterium]